MPNAGDVKQEIRRITLIGLTTTLLIGLGSLAYPLLVSAQPPVPAELSAQTPSALRGQAIYDARCTRCHGPQGAGDGEMAAQLPAAPPSFQDPDHMRQVTPAGYFDIITNGNMQALMPPWGGELSAQERWDVLFYIWSLSTSRENLDMGEKIYAQECAECHGDAGAGVDAIDLSDQATMATRSQADLVAGIRDGHADAGWKDTRTDEERAAVADYVRTFTYDTVFSAESAVGDGVIEGQVVEGTAGAQADLSGLQVSAFPIVGQTTLTPITVTTDADGKFRIENLATDPDRNYGLQVTYNGVDYIHPDVVNLGDSPTTSVTVHVYETTTDASNISLDRHHVIIDFNSSQLQVAELYIFRNSGDRTYIGTGQTLRFSLPNSAQGLEFDDPRMSESTELTEDGVVDTLPVPPGTRQVLLSYSVPYSDGSMDFAKQIVYATQNLNVLVADVGVDVDAGSLTKGDPVATQTNVQFLNFTQQNAPAGDMLSLKLSNLPSGGSSSSLTVPADRSNTLRWFGLGFVLIGAMFVLAYPALRPRFLAAAVATGDLSVNALRRQRRLLLEEIADLDDAYDAGELPEIDYVDARAEAKAELIDVMRRLQSLESGES